MRVHLTIFSLLVDHGARRVVYAESTEVTMSELRRCMKQASCTSKIMMC